jgi:hypothetical protein
LGKGTPVRIGSACRRIPNGSTSSIEMDWGEFIHETRFNGIFHDTEWQRLVESHDLILLPCITDLPTQAEDANYYLHLVVKCLNPTGQQCPSKRNIVLQ